MRESDINRPLLRQLLALGMVALACRLGVTALTLLDITGGILVSQYRVPLGRGLALQSPMLLPALPALLAAVALLLWAPPLARRLSGDRVPGPAWEPWSLQAFGLGLGVGGLALLVSMLTEISLPLQYAGPGGTLRIAAALAMVVVALRLLRRWPADDPTQCPRSPSAAAIIGATCVGVGAYVLIALIGRVIPTLIYLPVHGGWGRLGQAERELALQQQAAAAVLRALAAGWLLWYGRHVLRRPGGGVDSNATLLGLGAAGPVVVAACTHRLGVLGHLWLIHAVPTVGRRELVAVGIGVPLEALAWALVMAAGVWLIVGTTRPVGQAKDEEAEGSLLPTAAVAGTQVLGLGYLLMAVSMIAVLPGLLSQIPQVSRDLPQPVWLIPAAGMVLDVTLGVLLLALKERLARWLMPSPAAGPPAVLGPDWRLPVLTAALAGVGFYLVGTNLPPAVRECARNLPVGGSLLGAAALGTLAGLVLMLVASRLARWALRAVRPRPAQQNADGG